MKVEWVIMTFWLIYLFAILIVITVLGFFIFYNSAVSL